MQTELEWRAQQSLDFRRGLIVSIRQQFTEACVSVQIRWGEKGSERSVDYLAYDFYELEAKASQFCLFILKISIGSN